MKKFEAVETFLPMNDEQEFFNIKIFYDVPITEVRFDQNDLLSAIQITALKFLAGFNNEDDVEIYLNNHILSKNELLFWEDEENFLYYVKNSLTLITKEENTIIIKFPKTGSFQYSKHIIIYENDKNTN